MNKFDKLLTAATDLELCSAVADAILDKHGGDFDAQKCAPEERTVVLVFTANGIIRNGGFRYLFEGRLRGDPTFRRTLQAFETLAVKPAVTAFRRALAILPDARTRKGSVIKQLQVYLSVPRSRRDKIDALFWDADEQIMVALAGYIRANRGYFVDLVNAS